jgi:hypothetical protein
MFTAVPDAEFAQAASLDTREPDAPDSGARPDAKAAALLFD